MEFFGVGNLHTRGFAEGFIRVLIIIPSSDICRLRHRMDYPMELGVPNKVHWQSYQHVLNAVLLGYTPIDIAYSYALPNTSVPRYSVEM